MSPAELQHRRAELDAEWQRSITQLERLAGLRVVPGNESPADVEGRLLQRLDEIKYHAGCLRFLERDGRLPPGLET